MTSICFHHHIQTDSGAQAAIYQLLIKVLVAGIKLQSYFGHH